MIKDGGPHELGLASEQISEVNRLYWRHGLDQEAFCARQFTFEHGNRHLARNPTAFDDAIAAGEKALAAGDARALRGALFDIWLDQFSMGDGVGAGERASLMRA
jgi:hypothetical protein